MNRAPWIVLSGVLTALFVTSAVLLMLPVEFKMRKNANKGASGARIAWTNLMCQTPSPNLNVSNAELLAYWKLPSTVRLSPSMDVTGRCAIAVVKRNQKTWTKTSCEICYCVNQWWVPVVAVVALLCGVCSCVSFLVGLAVFKTPVTADEIARCARYQFLRHVLIAASLIAFFVSQSDHFTYTNYGDLFPTAYFDGFQLLWNIAMWLFVSGGILQTCCGYGLAMCVEKDGLGKQNQTKERDTKNSGWKTIDVKKREPKPNQGKVQNETAKVAVKTEIADQSVQKGGGIEKSAGTAPAEGKQPPVTLPWWCREDHQPSPTVMVGTCRSATSENSDTDTVIVPLVLSGDSEKEETAFTWTEKEGWVPDAQPKKNVMQ